jgi:hypothetical protein
MLGFLITNTKLTPSAQTEHKHQRHHHKHLVKIGHTSAGLTSLKMPRDSGDTYFRFEGKEESQILNKAAESH